MRAYILIVVEPRMEEEVVKKLKKIKGIVEAEQIFGEYDVIAIAETESIAELSRIIDKVRSKTKGVIRTSTMITKESYRRLR
ncbi:MAG: Lrp/AsnC ligand binding domain-containing protein [Candidatus Aenigmarchaeota archaeon]|nr:Lrp/AsnC ligand binding domain-containing protein [Candidatus Aenigmarchaeota archaeon]